MPDMNKVFLMGNLTRDPTLRSIPGGAAVCDFGLAINRRYRTSSGEDREETCFVEIETWRRQAETCDRYLSKGSPVLVEGRLKYDQWEDRDTGKKRSKLRVTAQRVQFLGSPDSDKDAGGGGFGGSAARSESETSGQGKGKDMPPFEEVNDQGDDIPF